MWLQFLLALPVCFIFVCLPGYLFARACNYDPFFCFAFAPLITTTIYTLLGIIFVRLGVFASWASVALPSIIVSLLIYIGGVYLRHTQQKSISVSHHAASRSVPIGFIEELKIFAPYLVIALVVCVFYHIRPLDGPASFTWKTDNSVHLNLVWRYVKSGEWSIFSSSLFEDVSHASIMGKPYYPAAWHVLAAMITGFTKQNAAFGANVINTILLVPCFTAGIYLFLRTTLKEKTLALRLGALLPLAFGVFPWHILIPQAKNAFFFGMVLLPAFLAVCIMVFEDALQKKYEFGKIIIFVIGLLALVFAHPSMAFTLGVALIPYLIWVIWRGCTNNMRRNSRLGAFVAVGVFLFFVMVAWQVCYEIPLVNSVAQYIHYAYAPVRATAIEALFLGFKDVPAQPVLALFVWLGVLYSFYRRKYLWISGSFFLFCTLFIISASLDGSFKQYMTGFWYTDWNRLASIACILAMPLAALGMESMVRVAQYLFGQLAVHDVQGHFKCFLIPCIFLVVSFVMIFYPNITIPYEDVTLSTAFGYTRNRAYTFNAISYSILDQDERDFLVKVKSITGDNLVLNVPGDGSAFAYPLSDINTYYRQFGGGNTPESELISNKINEYASNHEVQNAVKTTGAQYLLLLDKNFDAKYAKSSLFDKFHSRDWQGFVSLTDETPGFKVVLDEGDMRLYKIDALTD
nr:DUF6541 family protein [Olegusella massiliensis]